MPNIETPKIPKKAWIDFSVDEQSKLKTRIVALTWKDEGLSSGPLFVEFNIKEWNDFAKMNLNATRNFADGEVRSFGKTEFGFYAKRFSLEWAKKYAKLLGKDLQTI